MKVKLAVKFSLVLLAAVVTVPAWAAAPAVVDLRVFPADVHLHTQRDRQSLVVQAVLADGTTKDVTAEATYRFADPQLVRMDGHVLYGAADGRTELTVGFAGRELKVPVEVVDSQAEREISFKLDVMPVFMKSGCNSGSCHGSSRGQDGFRLSLFGFDPDGDYYRLTREMPGRRINLGLPSESLLLDKSIGEVAHSGGERFTSDSELYSTIVRWIEAGAPKDSAEVAVPVSLEFLPSQMVLAKGATQRMTVRAKYSDGTDRDVTQYALFLTSNEGSAAIDADGVVTAGERGEAHVFARFATFTVGAEAIILPENLAYQWPNVPEFNYIDTLVHDKLKKLRILPSEVCTDEVFLRRAYLDLIGLPPTRDEYEKFMASSDPNKRTQLVDELLQRPEFVDVWSMKWGDVLQVVSDNNRRDTKATWAYARWIKEKVAANTPVDQFVRDLLTAVGTTFADPPANFYSYERTPEKTAENVAQVFLGMRIQCSQCHNHPFDRWTMNDYYGFTSFFAGIKRKNAADYRDQVVYHDAVVTEVKHPVDGRLMPPKFLGADTPHIEGQDPRMALAQWMTSPDNVPFRRNIANVAWAHFFGRGIIDEVDDVRVSNPASNDALLDQLGQKLVEYKFDLKRLIRDICTSRTYQLSTRTNPTNELDERNFSHALLRRLRAEVLLDTISQVTAVPDRYSQMSLGARATQLPDGKQTNFFLTTFGRATRLSVCSCEVQMEPNLSQALHLLNGDTINGKVTSTKVIRDMLTAGRTSEEVVDELYIRALSRRPTAVELVALRGALDGQEGTARQEVLEDVLWSLLNSKEFMFNH